MSVSTQEAKAAVAELSMLRYFPSDVAARVGITSLLARMVDSPERLRWLVRTMVDEVGTWEGPKELRAVYCSRFRPADGVEADCTHGSLAGSLFGPDAAEARQIEAHQQVKALPPAPMELPALRRIK